MPHYLIQVAYNTRGIAGLVKEPQDRIEKVRPAVEALGRRIECAHYAFDEHDIVLTVEMPDNSKAAAMALAVGAGGDRCELPDDGPPYAGGGDERDARRRGLGVPARGGLSSRKPRPGSSPPRALGRRRAAGLWSVSNRCPSGISRLVILVSP